MIDRPWPRWRIWWRSCGAPFGFAKIHYLEERGFVIGARLVDQLIVGAGLDQTPLIEDEDVIGLAQEVEPAGDNESGTSGHGLAERGDDFIFGLGIHGSSGVIENEDGRFQQ